MDRASTSARYNWLLVLGLLSVCRLVAAEEAEVKKAGRFIRIKPPKVYIRPKDTLEPAAQELSKSVEEMKTAFDKKAREIEKLRSDLKTLRGQIEKEQDGEKRKALRQQYDGVAGKYEVAMASYVRKFVSTLADFNTNVAPVVEDQFKEFAHQLAKTRSSFDDANSDVDTKVEAEAKAYNDQRAKAAELRKKIENMPDGVERDKLQNELEAQLINLKAQLMVATIWDNCARFLKAGTEGLGKMHAVFVRCTNLLEGKLLKFYALEEALQLMLARTVDAKALQASFETIFGPKGAATQVSNFLEIAADIEKKSDYVMQLMGHAMDESLNLKQFWFRMGPIVEDYGGTLSTGLDSGPQSKWTDRFVAGAEKRFDEVVNDLEQLPDRFERKR